MAIANEYLGEEDGMTEAVKQCLEIIDRAIQFEDTGINFFEERAARAKSALERNLFRSLAKDEVGHKEYLTQLRQELTAANRIDAMSPASGQHPTARHIFESAMSGAHDPYDYKTEELEILKGAMEVERKGFAMYSRAVESVDSEHAKQIFRHLATEEQKHYTLLKNTHDYMEDPEAWNEFDEGSMLDGG
jgi:rubrerythrin